MREVALHTGLLASEEMSHDCPKLSRNVSIVVGGQHFQYWPGHLRQGLMSVAGGDWERRFGWSGIRLAGLTLPGPSVS